MHRRGPTRPRPRRPITLRIHTPPRPRQINKTLQRRPRALPSAEPPPRRRLMPTLHPARRVRERTRLERRPSFPHIPILDIRAGARRRARGLQARVA